MTLDEAMALIEREFVCHEWEPSADPSVAPTGDPYVVVCPGGIKAEGEGMPVLCASAEIAVRLWLAEMSELKRALYERQTRRPGATEASPMLLPPYHLYWRVKPELDCSRIPLPPIKLDDGSEIPGEELEIWILYSRLLVTDKAPPLKEAA